MEPLFLKDLEQGPWTGPHAGIIKMLQSTGNAVPQIMYLFACKPKATNHLSLFSQEVMRGPSPLSPGMRELIAAFTSKHNQCPF